MSHSGWSSSTAVRSLAGIVRPRCDTASTSVPSTSTAFTNESSSRRCATRHRDRSAADDLAHLTRLRRAAHERGVVDAHDGDVLANGAPGRTIPPAHPPTRPSRRTRARPIARVGRRRAPRRTARVRRARSGHDARGQVDRAADVDAAGAVGIGPAPERARPADPLVAGVLVDTCRGLDPSALVVQSAHAVVLRAFQQVGLRSRVGRRRVGDRLDLRDRQRAAHATPLPSPAVRSVAAPSRGWNEPCSPWRPSTPPTSWPRRGGRRRASTRRSPPPGASPGPCRPHPTARPRRTAPPSCARPPPSNRSGSNSATSCRNRSVVRRRASNIVLPRTIMNRGSRGSSHHSIRTYVRVKGDRREVLDAARERIRGTNLPRLRRDHEVVTRCVGDVHGAGQGVAVEDEWQRAPGEHVGPVQESEVELDRHVRQHVWSEYQVSGLRTPATTCWIASAISAG